jgi:hypothetical protein
MPEDARHQWRQYHCLTAHNNALRRARQLQSCCINGLLACACGPELTRRLAQQQLQRRGTVEQYAADAVLEQVRRSHTHAAQLRTSLTWWAVRMCVCTCCVRSLIEVMLQCYVKHLWRTTACVLTLLLLLLECPALPWHFCSAAVNRTLPAASGG